MICPFLGFSHTGGERPAATERAAPRTTGISQTPYKRPGGAAETEDAGPQSISGVMANSEEESMFRMLSEDKKIRYIIYMIEGRKVVVEAAVSQEELCLAGDGYDDSSKGAYEKFVADIQTRTDGFTDCRYAVFDFKFTCSRVGAGTSKMDKIVFLQLCPDGASKKTKIAYAASAPAFTRSLGTGKFLQFQVSDESEMSHTALLSKLTEKYADN